MSYILSKTEQDKLVYRKQYTRKVDKSQIPTCRIMGCEILDADMEWLIRFIEKNIEYLSGDYITISATKELVMASEDKEFYLCQNGGVLAIPDGGPLKTYGKLHGHKGMKRITGPDLMLELFKASEKHGWRHYFYGTTQDTLDKMTTKLKNEYPGLQIAGTHPSMFRNLSSEEDQAVVAEINATNPDFVWFSLGAPKGNYFASDHQGLISGLMLSVGAGFDYYAENIERAPSWMQKADLEWLYRIIQDPKRLAKRYFVTIPKFLCRAYFGRNKS